MTFTRIATFLNVSATLVRAVCIGAIEGRKLYTTNKPKSQKLDAAHIDFLLSKETLDSMKGYSLAERSSLFQRQFPDKELTGGKLWHLYNSKGIKHKKILAKKTAPPQKAEEIQEMAV